MRKMEYQFKAGVDQLVAWAQNLRAQVASLQLDPKPRNVLTHRLHNVEGDAVAVQEYLGAILPGEAPPPPADGEDEE